MNFIFPYIGNFIIPTDEVIFSRGVRQPPTSKMVIFHSYVRIPEGKYPLDPMTDPIKSINS